jgi:hypothetical protein
VQTGFWAVVTFGVISAAYGQRLVVDGEPRPDTPPKLAAEERRKLFLDPDTMYTRLISKDDRLKRETVKGLGESWLAERDFTDVRLFAVNLDADRDLERVLMFRSGGLDGAAVIAKQEDGVWWELGSFRCCGPGGSPRVEPFIELRETVWYGTKDIVVHLGGPQGTGVGERDVSIYRVLRGRLYKVLQIVEWTYNLAGEETSRIDYPDVGSSVGPSVIAVKKTKQVGSRRTVQCTPYQWDRARFAFVQIAPTRLLCGGDD